LKDQLQVEEARCLQHEHDLRRAKEDKLRRAKELEKAQLELEEQIRKEEKRR
jgi:hypothetical protein